MRAAPTSPKGPRVAVTGGVAEGKSTVLGYLAELGVATVSADAVAHRVVSDRFVQAEIGRRLEITSGVDRESIRKAILADPSKRRALNSILHGRVAQALLDDPAPVAEVPLLIETCMHPFFDFVWVVTCGPAEQLRRLTERLGEETQARALIATQLPTRSKLPFADAIVRTNCGPDDVQRAVASLAAFHGLLP